jgi:hypothetical protein
MARLTDRARLAAHTGRLQQIARARTSQRERDFEEKAREQTILRKEEVFWRKSNHIFG